MAPVLIDVSWFLGTTIGCIVVPYNHYGEYREVVCDSIVKAMGFKDVKEYFKLYPGHMYWSSNTTRDFCCNHAGFDNFEIERERYEDLEKDPYKKFCTYLDIDYEVCGKVGSAYAQIQISVKRNVEYNLYGSRESILLLPKMDDLKQVMRSDDDISFSDCWWFCKDSKENSKEVVVSYD